MNSIPVPTPLVQSIGEYLSRQPYREVAQLLNGLQEAASAAATPEPLPDARPDA